MPKQHAKRKTAHNVKMLSKAGKAAGGASAAKPGKAPQRTVRQAGGMRASVNRGGKSRVNG
jgi:hypothetical protein